MPTMASLTKVGNNSKMDLLLYCRNMQVSGKADNVDCRIFKTQCHGIKDDTG